MADEAEKERLVKELTKELHEENLAVFIGAGLSSPAGFVNWKELLTPIAEELELDINREEDLVSLAQYYINRNGGNRGHLNQILVEKFCHDAHVTENHRILARLPIGTYWTTNYDKLIEDSLKDARKIADVKYENEQFLYTKPKRDAIVYKMHGDVDLPARAVLIKDDYEKYYINRKSFLDALRGDLTSKTFLFLGISFSDPNLDYILSRVRVSHGANQRRHYCILRAVQKRKNEDRAEYEYRQRKQELFVQDLLRFGIKAILVDEYSEITQLLESIERRFRRKTVFISGAAYDYAPYKEASVIEFLQDLSSDILEAESRIVSGFGLGIGSAIISGALKHIYMAGSTLEKGQLLMRPFPQGHDRQEDRRDLWREYRNDMISRAGIALFLFGNKLADGNTVLSDGMREEFEIAKERGLFLLPVGATGYMARRLWEEVNERFDEVNSGVDELVRAAFARLGDEQPDLERLRADIMAIVNMLIS